MSGHDPLARLRDIQLPDDSGLSLAFFAVALATLLAVVAAALLAALTRRRGSMKAQALRLLDESERLEPQERVLAQAKLLRRLARTLGGDGSLKLQGRDWLAHLDKLFATDFFSAGNGQVFGEALYGRDVGDAPDTAALRRLIATLRC